MSEAIQQKLSAVQAAEQSIATNIQKLIQTVQEAKLKEILQKINQETIDRSTKLGQVVGTLKLKAEPSTNETINGIVKELQQYSQAQPSPATDTNIAAGIQKLLVTLATDYSYAANIAYEKKQESTAIASLSESFDSLQKTNEELSGIAQELFKKVGSSSDPQPQKPSIVDKAKKAVTAAKQAVTQS